MKRVLRIAESLIQQTRVEFVGPFDDITLQDLRYLAKFAKAQALRQCPICKPRPRLPWPMLMIKPEKRGEWIKPEPDAVPRKTSTTRTRKVKKVIRRTK